uniref:Uncharacterized protein n=1 Tax=Acrobeloides nanus TaxID=290746 RepID=A0A914C0V3_9BILA
MKSVINYLVIFCLVYRTYASLASGISFNTTKNITPAKFQCLFNSNVEKFIGKVYNPDGTFDDIGINNLINEYIEDYDDGNYDIAHIYVTPCLVNCKNGPDFNGDEQAKAIVKGLKIYFESYFMWINIDRTQPWSADQMKNRAFLTDFINTFFDLNGFVGIMTSNNSWSTIFGANFTVIDKAPFLLWINWNGIRDLTTDFTQFGGWMAPNIHEYAGNVITNSCIPGISVNFLVFDNSNDNFAPKKVVKVRSKFNRSS